MLDDKSKTTDSPEPKSAAREKQEKQEEISLNLYPSATLDSLKNSPEKLSPDILVQIFKEMGYRFYDEKDFIKEAALYLQNPGIQEELIKKLSKEREVMRQRRSAPTKGAKYERIGLNNNKIKIVKQKNTILWFVNFSDYEYRLKTYFAGQKKDFDQELGPRDSIAAQQKYQKS